MVVIGIANPAPMLQYISHFHDLREKLLYPDHHNFTSNDLNDITTRFSALKGEKNTSSPQKKMQRDYDRSHSMTQ